VFFYDVFILSVRENDVTKKHFAKITVVKIMVKMRLAYQAVKRFIQMLFNPGKRTCNTIITAVSCLPGLILTNVYTIGCWRPKVGLGPYMGYRLFNHL